MTSLKRTCPVSLAAFVVAAALALPSPSALAAPPKPPTAAAQRAFNEGQKLYDKGRHEDALARFRNAHAATNSPNARLMVARCLLALGKTLEAYEELTATRTEAATLAETQPKYEAARDSASTELAALDPKVGRVVVALSNPEGARVTLNGTALPTERLGVAIAVLPGKVVVEVEPAKGAKMQREETVAGGQTKTIIVGPGAEKPRTEATKPVPEETGSVRIAGFVVAGLGVVGLGVFGVTTGLAQDKYDGLVDRCGGKRCTDTRDAGVVDEGKRLEKVSVGALVGGVAGVAVGALMIALGGPRVAKKAEARIEVGPGGAFVRVGGSF